MSESAKRKGTSISLIIAMLFMTFSGRANTFVAPALAKFAQAYPDVSLANIQMIMTAGMIGNFPATFITGIIADKIKPKPLVIFGTALVSFGALFPIWFHSSIWLLYISNFLMGLGQGISLTVNSILIAQLFEEPMRSRMFGWRGSVQQIGSMLLTVAAGFFAVSGPFNVYYTGVFTLPALICSIFLLPNVEKASKSREEVEAKEAEKAARKAQSGIPAQTWFLAIMMCLYGIGFAVSIINSAMLLDAQMGLGPEVSGITSGLTGVISILAGIIYKNVAFKLRQNILWVGAAITALGNILEYNATAYPMFLAGACCISLGFIFFYTGGMHALPKMVHPAQVSFGMGLYLAFHSLGSMVTPYVINPIGTALTGVESAKSNYLAGVVWSIVVIVLAIIWAFPHKKFYDAEMNQLKAEGKI